MADEFWLFDGLEDEPYGMLPLQNVSSKGGPTGIKLLQRVGSYNWDLSEQEEPTIVVPGEPREYGFWSGGRLPNDRGVLVYDVNRMKLPEGPMDPVVIVPKMIAEEKGETFDFNSINVITDALNLQKLFAFCRNEGEGLFRIDCERVGNTVLLTRVEASSLMTIDYETFDQALKQQMTKAKSKLTEGPYFQLATYQFGQFKILVRHEVDAADFGPPPDPDAAKVSENGPAVDKTKPVDGVNLTVITKGTGGQLPCDAATQSKKQSAALAPSMVITSYPQGGGFPFFLWAQLLFSGAEQAVVGWYKPPNDFARPAQYSLADVSKMMKPLPLPALAKVHDCLHKIRLFLTQNEAHMKVALIWKGVDAVEIFHKLPASPGGLSAPVRAVLENALAIAPPATD